MKPRSFLFLTISLVLVMGAFWFATSPSLLSTGRYGNSSALLAGSRRALAPIRPLQVVDVAAWSTSFSDSRFPFRFVGHRSKRTVNWCSNGGQFLPPYFVAYDPDDDSSDYTPYRSRKELKDLFPGNMPVMGEVLYPSTKVSGLDSLAAARAADAHLIRMPSTFDFAGKRATTEHLFKPPRHIAGVCKKVNAAFGMATGGADRSSMIAPLMNSWREYATPCDFLIFFLDDMNHMIKIRRREAGMSFSFVERSDHSSSSSSSPAAMYTVSSTKGPIVFLNANDWLDPRTSLGRAEADRVDLIRLFLLTHKNTFRFVMNLDSRDTVVTAAPFEPLERLAAKLRKSKASETADHSSPDGDLNTQFLSATLEASMTFRQEGAHNPGWVKVATNSARMVEALKDAKIASVKADMIDLIPCTVNCSTVPLLSSQENWRIVTRNIDRGDNRILNSGQYHGTATAVLDYVTAFSQNILRIPEIHGVNSTDRAVRNAPYGSHGFDQGVHNGLIFAGLRAAYFPHLVIVLDERTSRYRNNYAPFHNHATTARVNLLGQPLNCPGSEQPAADMIPPSVPTTPRPTAAPAPTAAPVSTLPGSLVASPSTAPQPPPQPALSPEEDEIENSKLSRMHQGHVISVLHQPDRHWSAMRVFWVRYGLKDVPHAPIPAVLKPCAPQTENDYTSKARASGGIAAGPRFFSAFMCGSDEKSSSGGGGNNNHSVADADAPSSQLQLTGPAVRKSAVPLSGAAAASAARRPVEDRINFECTSHHIFFAAFDLAGNPFRGEEARCVALRSTPITEAPPVNGTPVPTMAPDERCSREGDWETATYEKLQRVVATFQRLHSSCEMLVVLLSGVDAQRAAAVSFDTMWDNVRFVEMPDNSNERRSAEDGSDASIPTFNPKAVAASAAAWLEAARPTFRAGSRVVVGVAFDDAVTTDLHVTSNLFAPIIQFEQSSLQTTAEKQQKQPHQQQQQHQVRQLSIVALRSESALSSSSVAAIFFSCHRGAATALDLTLQILRDMAAAGAQVPPRCVAYFSSIRGGDDETLETKLAPYRNFAPENEKAAARVVGATEAPAPDPTRTWIRDGAGVPWTCADTPVALILSFPTARAAWGLSPLYLTRRPSQMSWNYTQWRGVGVLECPGTTREEECFLAPPPPPLPPRKRLPPPPTPAPPPPPPPRAPPAKSQVFSLEFPVPPPPAVPLTPRAPNVVPEASEAMKQRRRDAVAKMRAAGIVPNVVLGDANVLDELNKPQSDPIRDPLPPPPRPAAPPAIVQRIFMSSPPKAPPPPAPVQGQPQSDVTWPV